MAHVCDLRGSVARVKAAVRGARYVCDSELKYTALWILLQAIK